MVVVTHLSKGLVEKSGNNFYTKLRNNKFSLKFILKYGVQLGGHVGLLEITSSSVVYGIRSKNILINLSSTSIELIKVLKIIEGLGFKRGYLYFINSTITFRFAFKSAFFSYNKHLFFPVYCVIKNVFKKFKLLLLTKNQTKKVKKSLKLRRTFLLKSGKNLLRKVFIATKWPSGFVSNSASFFSFADNVLNEKIQFGKMVNKFQTKVKAFIDFYPFLPHFGFIGDHKANYWAVNEFKMSGVPLASVIDTFSTKSLFGMYGIPGNSASIDSTLFFLILSISNYLVGFNQHILKYCIFKFTNKVYYNKNKFYLSKKQFFFKNYLLKNLL